MKKTLIHICSLIVMLIGTMQTNAQWITLNSGTSVYLVQTFFVTDSLGYLLGYGNGAIFKTTDGGQSWTSPGQTSSCTSIYFVSADTGFACGDGAGIYKTTDGANSWSHILITNDFISSFSFPGNGQIGYAAGIDNGNDSLVIYKTSDRGRNWKRWAWPEWIIDLGYIFFTDTNTGYFVDDLAGINKTTDGGMTWINQYIDTSNFHNFWVQSIFFPSKDTGYSVGEVILKTTDGGQHWDTIIQSVAGPIFESCYFTSTSKGFVVNSGGAIIETSDGGKTWKLDVNTTSQFNSIYFPSSNVGYACGIGGEVLKYNQPVGILESNKQNNFILSPNPATTQLTLHTSFNNEHATVSIMNVLGMETSPPAPLHMERGEALIDVSQLAAGVYFLQLRSEKGSATKMFVKE